MTRSCYLVTTLDRVLELPGKNVIFNYTPFARREYAIEGVSQMNEVGIPLVGRLELPDEYETTPDRCDPKYLVQLGYDPKIDKDVSTMIKLPIRRRHLMRLSVVSWNDVCDDDGGKQDLVSALERGSQEITTYTQDVTVDMIAKNPADMKDAEGLAKKFADILHQYDGLRKSHGFTVRDEQILHASRGVYFTYSAEVFAAKAAKSLIDAENCILPEMRAVHMEQAAEYFEKFQLLRMQMVSELARTLNLTGESEGIIPLELGEDEIEALRSGRITMEQLIKQQMEIDAPERRNA